MAEVQWDRDTRKQVSGSKKTKGKAQSFFKVTTMVGLTEELTNTRRSLDGL